MNHVLVLDLIRTHHAELRQAADHHRLVTATRHTASPLARVTRPQRRLRGIAEAEPCPP